MLVSHDALIMVLDGARMTLFRNKGSSLEPHLEWLAREERHTPSTAALGDDEPGRTFQSSGISRGAYETTDLHQQAEDEFTLDMAELLIFHMKHEDRKAVIIAPPRVLGLMRKHLPRDIRQRLIAEINKDYAGRPATEIADLLSNNKT